MIGSNFSLRVSVRPGKAQMGRLDPGRQTLLGAENPAKHGDHVQLWELGGLPICVCFHIVLTFPTILRCPENGNLSGKELLQIETQFLSEKIY